MVRPGSSAGLPGHSRLTRSSWRTCPHRKLRKGAQGAGCPAGAQHIGVVVVRRHLGIGGGPIGRGPGEGQRREGSAALLTRRSSKAICGRVVAPRFWLVFYLENHYPRHRSTFLPIQPGDTIRANPQPRWIPAPYRSTGQALRRYDGYVKVSFGGNHHGLAKAT